MTRILCLSVLLALPLWAQREEPAFRVPDSVELRQDIVYARYGARELRLDLYLPKSGAGPFPAVVYIHGGGWKNGSKSAFRRHAAHMATVGFVGACIEYRLSGEAKFPAAVHDSKAAVRWLRANAKQYRVNPDRIGAAGGSAGGHLVSMLGVTAGVKELEGGGGNPGVSSAVQAVAAFNPALDLGGRLTRAPKIGRSTVPDFLGKTFEQDPKLWAFASPSTHAGPKSAPHLFLHGVQDETVPFWQSEEMHKKLQAAGVRGEIFPAEGAGHGFFNRPPWFEPTLERMEKFFRETLR